MQVIAIKILKTMLINFMTYKLVATLVVELLDYLANHTENKVDDKLVSTIREALLEKPVRQDVDQP